MLEVAMVVTEEIVKRNEFLVNINNRSNSSNNNDTKTSKSQRLLLHPTWFPWNILFQEGSFTGQFSGKKYFLWCVRCFLLQIMLDNVRCEGSERSITQCRHHDWYKTNCDHYEDAGVKCHAPELQGHQVNNSRTTEWNFVLLTKRQLLSNSLK